MKLYTISLMAMNDDVVRVKPGVCLAADDTDAVKSGLEAAHAALPDTDGWFNHNVVIQEVPAQLDLEGWRLTWKARRLSVDKLVCTWCPGKAITTVVQHLACQGHYNEYHRRRRAGEEWPAIEQDFQRRKQDDERRDSHDASTVMPKQVLTNLEPS